MALVIFVTVHALVFPATTLNREAAEEEPGIILNVPEETPETEDGSETASVSEQDPAEEETPEVTPETEQMPEVTDESTAAEESEISPEPEPETEVTEEQTTEPEQSGEAEETVTEPEQTPETVEEPAPEETPAPAEEPVTTPETVTDPETTPEPTAIPEETTVPTAEPEATPEPTVLPEVTPEIAAVTYPAAEFEETIKDFVTVKASAEEGTFPEGTKMILTPVEEEEVRDTVEEAVDSKVRKIIAVDITFKDKDGKEVEPLKAINVTMSSPIVKEEESTPEVVHIDDKGKGTVVEQSEEESAEDEVIFTTDTFSVYVIAYTVDFHYEVDGKTYEYSLKGGSGISFRELLSALSIEKDEAFYEGIRNIEFSQPELVRVIKTEEDTTVGALKEKAGITSEYSSELTEEEINAINEHVIKAGEWALISLKAFDTEETLTVTMDNGEVFTVKVTDAQDPSVFLGKEVIIYDNTEKQAMTSNYATDHRTHFNTVPEPTADNDASAHWKIVQANGGYYLQSNDGKYLYLDQNDVRLVNNTSEATVLNIQAGTNPDYRISAANNNYNALRYCENNQYDPFFSAVNGTNGAGTFREWLYIREAAPAAPPAGDWLLYFDDDFSEKEITIHVGETITLRPYNKWEWKEGNTDVQTDHWNVGTWSDWNIYSSDGNGSKLSKTTEGPFEFTRYVKYDDQLITHYWSVQGKATQTGDYILTNTKNDKRITVHVVDGDPVNQPETIKKIANIKVNLFDYDKNYLLDPSNDNNLANNSNHKNESVNGMGGSDHFYFLSSGSGDSNNESWNNYTHANANTNIVKNELDSEGYPVLNHGRNTSLKYLFDPEQTSWHGGSNNDGMIAYPDVIGMFQKDPQTGYYYYNSNTNYFYYDTETGTSKLYEHTYTQTSSANKGSLVNDKPIGFFPFHEYDSTDNLYVNQNSNLNHHLGMSMEVEFMLPKDRLDDNGQPIVFDFSGDDDLWVFVEWEDDNGQKHSKLMLDLGGVHQPVTGQINFTEDLSIEAHKPYTLKVFYLERGGCDSNCSIRFNLPIVQDLTVAKKLTGLTEAEKAKYKDAEFTYEIIVNDLPYNGPKKPEKIVIRNAAGEDVTPENFTITDGRVTIKDGQTITISYLDRSDKFTVAEVKTDIMENFEVPNAERYYHLEHDASLYEEEIHLTTSRTMAEPYKVDWVTPVYELEDTEKVTFTNTLKEKNLEVEKKWIGEEDHPNSIYFTVSASVESENGGHEPYAVSVLKEENGTADRQFILSEDNHWRCEIEHLPVNTPDGRFIFYDISEGKVEGYALTAVTDLTAEHYNYCNVDVVKYWPDSNGEHTEVITVVLKNSDGKYYAGTGSDGEAIFVEDIVEAKTYDLTKDNNYTHRFERVPYGTYTAEQLHEDVYSKGLATYVRNIIQYQLENTPIENPVDPGEKPNPPVIHKRIDALRDGVTNPDSSHTDEDLTDLYRLYLDYKINSLQEANGVDLLFVIDHSGSMNNSAWQGNPYRAPAVEAALNGNEGLISEFLDMNENNQWAAVGFKGPDGALNYAINLFGAWPPITNLSRFNAGINGSEVLSPGGEDYVFTRTKNDVIVDNEGANILTNYTAGLWRAEQFLLKEDVINDGRKKVIVFISDGIPTLHIDCPDETLANAGTAAGSSYYRDGDGGCPNQTLTEFGYFVNDMTANGYDFGENVEFYTIGFGGTMQTQTGSQLLNGMLDAAYGGADHANHFMTISDTSGNYSIAAETLKNDLRKIMGMNETFTNIVIQDDLSKYVDLYGLVDAGSDTAAIMRAANAKVTMEVPDPDHPDQPQIITLYENGAPVDSDAAKFTRADGTTKANIIQKLEYNASSKTVKAVFDPEYEAAAGVVYTLSFDVKTTELAYTTYTASGYDKYTDGDNQGQTIKGDSDTDFLGTDPDNSTSSDKEGFRSNDDAVATYTHNGEDESTEYPHPVIQVFEAPIEILKTDQAGTALAGAKFNLYNENYDTAKAWNDPANLACKMNTNALVSTIQTIEQEDGSVITKAVITAENLKHGTYYLVETETPDGYNTLEGPVKIEVTVGTDDTVTVTASMNGKEITNPQLHQTEPGKNQWQLEVVNKSGVVLPHTGGHGTRIFTYIGSLLIILAGVLILRRQKNR